MTFILSDLVFKVFFRIGDGFDFILVIYEVPIPNVTVSAERSVCVRPN